MPNQSPKSLRSLFSKRIDLLKSCRHGLEKESLRASPKGEISKEAHPHQLGAALTHPQFTLDFSESQVEFVTQPYDCPGQAYQELYRLHQYAYQAIGKELLWVNSMPPIIEDEDEIMLASFGLTPQAHTKELYRLGLAHRCGKKMQLLSGIHYNFSWKDDFWQYWIKETGYQGSISDFKSEKYLHLTRNYLRWGWLISYLFGCSPVADQTYFSKKEPDVKSYQQHSAIASKGTSIRMSHLGYFSKIQLQLGIPFNSLNQYIDDLEMALTTPHPFYKKIGLYRDQKQIQISENFLQIEAEHYTRIRPKPNPNSKLRVVDALKKGIEYIEVRNLDLQSHLPMGLDVDTLNFIYLFLLVCLDHPSPPIKPQEAQFICQNQNAAALKGRAQNLSLYDFQRKKEIRLKDWALQILDLMKPYLKLLDDQHASYEATWETQVEKLNNPSNLPSVKLIQDMKTKDVDFSALTLAQSKQWKKQFTQAELPQSWLRNIEKSVQQSHKELIRLEQQSEDVLSGYEDMEFSTQMLMREARIRGFNFEVLDRRKNIIKINTPKKSILVQQATQSHHDSLMSFLAMENKFVTQTLLNQAGLNGSGSRLYLNAEAALNDYSLFCDQKIVMKPNQANMGEGIFFVEPRQKKEFKHAALEIEKKQDQILIEPFFKAPEYRLLVIGGKVVAVALRLAAHVKGNGQDSISALIDQKNKENKTRAQFQKPLELTVQTRKLIAEQGFKLSDIPARNQIVWLRKNSNVSTGGESHDVTDFIHPKYKKIAIEAAASANAKICGVDMLIKSYKKPPSATNYVIIELNHNPALFIHRSPSSGKKRYVEKNLLDFLMK